MKLENISKPKIVDFLRVCDRKNWVFPRIRYASVRSKPTLLKDIRAHFQEAEKGSRLQLVPLHKAVRCPDIQYDFEKKEFLFDGVPIDLPKAAKVEFRIIPGPVVMHFGSASAPAILPANCGGQTFQFQKPHTRSAQDFLDRNLRFGR